jgi:beta-glucosidase
MRTRGVTQVLSPVIDLARDPRWGRTEECFSEDPYLVAQFGLAAVRGCQGREEKDLLSGKHVQPR